MILLTVLIPVSIMLFFAILSKSKKKVKALTNKNIVVKVPEIVLLVGITCALMSFAVVFCFTFFSKEKPHIIFYLVFGLFILLGVFLILKTLIFKVIVAENIITVYPIFKKPYSFTFDEIVSATRQVKNNQIKSERIVNKTSKNKKLIVESTEISYKKFREKIEKEVDDTMLVGFNKTST